MGLNETLAVLEEKNTKTQYGGKLGKDPNELKSPTRAQCYKTFYGHNLRVFVIS
jgi:hypothetical protein